MNEILEVVDRAVVESQRHVGSFMALQWLRALLHESVHHRGERYDASPRARDGRKIGGERQMIVEVVLRAEAMVGVIGEDDALHVLLPGSGRLLRVLSAEN